MVVENAGQRRSCLCLAYWPERIEEPAETWGPWAGLGWAGMGQQFPQPRTTALDRKGGADFSIPRHLPAVADRSISWDRDESLENCPDILQAFQMGKRESHWGPPLRPPKGQERNGDTQRHHEFSEIWIEGLGWRGSYEGAQKVISEVPPGPDPLQTQMSQQPGKAGCYQCIATPQVETESASQDESGTASFQKLLKKAGYIRVSLGSPRHGRGGRG